MRVRIVASQRCENLRARSREERAFLYKPRTSLKSAVYKQKANEKHQKCQEKVEVRNQIESYIFSVKQAVQDSGSKLDESDKSKVTQLCEDTVRWLDNNTLADKDEYKHKLEELQKTCSPIMARIHQGGASGPQDCGAQFRQEGNGCNSGPTVEEVD